MTFRQQVIEDSLRRINDALFQNLCNAYLSMSNPELISFNCTGSQIGRQKSVKGTPDCFFRTAEGDLIFVEYTTKEKDLVKKITEDIDKCLDTDKTGVEAEKIYEIRIFFNTRLNTKDEKLIVEYAHSKGVQIRLIGLDRLTQELSSPTYSILAHKFLGVGVEIPQLLPLERFIEEYSNKAGNLATPLNNPFLYREEYLKEIEEKLELSDLIIITGSPGVGKTKFALESIQRFIASHGTYSALLVSDKGQNIAEDLRIYLRPDESYILLVDDAHRQQGMLEQILKFFKERRDGNIKLLLTVRDYALEDIRLAIFEYGKREEIHLNKFTNDEIRGIISEVPFEIKNSVYQRKIVALAEGNARLALMASRLAKEKLGYFLYSKGNDIFMLFDDYFKTFIKDFDVFRDKIVLKTLGIISFFYSIDLGDEQFIESITRTFDLDTQQFKDAIEKLNEKELLDRRLEYVKISEQELGTYFFYKVFIKEAILPFGKLLSTFFSNYSRRFQDTIIPANNHFGYENVLDKIDGNLNDYYASIKNDENAVLSFFSVFYFCKRTEMLVYFHSVISQMEEPKNVDYYIEDDFDNRNYPNRGVLYFLSQLFSFFSDCFEYALSLSFEYCRKNPQTLPRLVKYIEDIISFNRHDESNSFQRQKSLFKIVIEGFNEKKPHYIEPFFLLAEHFLGYRFMYMEGVGKEFWMGEVRIGYSLVFREIRHFIWSTLFEAFSGYEEKVLYVLDSYKNKIGEPDLKLLEFDLSLLLPFIEKSLTSSKFEHIDFVRQLTQRIDKKVLPDEKYKEINDKFTSKEYEYFVKMNWRYSRNRETYQYPSRNDFEQQKEQDLRTSFLFSSEEDFSDFFIALERCILYKEKKCCEQVSLDIIIEENLKQSEEIGKRLLEATIQRFPARIEPKERVVSYFVNQSSSSAQYLWYLIDDSQLINKAEWKLLFLRLLPKEQVNRFYQKALLRAISSLNHSFLLSLEELEKFIPSVESIPTEESDVFDTEETFVKEILSIVYQKNEESGFTIWLPQKFFERYAHRLPHCFELLKKSYIQQRLREPDFFDFSHAGLKAIVDLEPSFLLFYLEHLMDLECWEKMSLSWTFIWELEDGLIEKAFLKIIRRRKFYGIGEHTLNRFFSPLDDVALGKVEVFIKNFIHKYNRESDIMDAVFNVIIRSLKDCFPRFFVQYLSLNTDFDSFQCIHWIEFESVTIGNEIRGYKNAEKWKAIREMIPKSSSLEVILITHWIEEQIKTAKKEGDSEMLRDFRRPASY